MSRWFTITRNKVLAFALACVAISSGFLMFMQDRLIDILSASDWCARAINAEKLANPRGQSAIEHCKNLLEQQVGSLGVALYINTGTIALCLLVLMVIVVAGGKLDFSASKDGISGTIERDDAAQAARETAAAAVDEAEKFQ